MSETISTKAGFVALVGLPNAGKSTLINSIFKQKMSIVSPKVQTTRFSLNTIYSEKQTQIIFIDTPGIIKKPIYLMQKKMMSELDKAAEVADIFLFIVDVCHLDEEFHLLIAPWLRSGRAHLTLLNKTDQASAETIEEKTNWLAQHGFQNILPFVATKTKSAKTLIKKLKSLLPESPFYYEDPEQLSDRSTRFFCAELVREQLYALLDEELPYETTVLVHEYHEKERVTVIYANIIVSKESQKKIVIGKRGAMLNQIGCYARKNIEAFLGVPVYLDLHVKVRPHWREKGIFLKEYGFSN